MKKLTACGLFLLATTVYASWPLEVCGDNNLQLFPSVVKTSNGYITAFVNNNTDGKHCEIYAQRFTDDGEEDSLWNSAVLVSVDTVTYYHGHRLAARAIPGNTDTAIVAWINHKDYTLCAQKVGPSGSKEWNGGDRPKIITTIAAHTLYEPPHMCSDGNGGAIFGWVETGVIDDTTRYYLKVRKIPSSGSGGWTEVVAGPSIGKITLPRICADDNDGAMIAWVQKDDSDGHWLIYLASVDSSGTVTSDPTEVADAYDLFYNIDQDKHWVYWSAKHNHHWKSLTLAVSGSNTYIAAKRRVSPAIDHRPEAPKIGVMRGEENVIFRIGSGSDGDTITLWDISDYGGYDYGWMSGTGKIPAERQHKNPIDRECYSCLGSPVITPSSDGGLFITWSRDEWVLGVGKALISSIYTAKINSSGGFIVNPVSISSNVFSSSTPQIITVGDTALVAWQKVDPWKKSTLYYRKVTNNGSSGSNPTSISGNDAGSFDLIHAGGTNAVVVWNKGTSADWDIYAKKFSF